MRKPKYWVKFHINECPVCGRGDEYRERMYTPKPENLNDRYEFSMFYDGCEEF